MASLVNTLKRSKWQIAVIAVVIAITAWLKTDFTNFVNQFNAYCNVYRTDTRADVRYRLGNPPWVENNTANADGFMSVYKTDAAAGSNSAIPPNKIADEFYIWVYPVSSVEGLNNSINVSFDASNKKVRYISCMGSEASDCPPLAGVSINETEKNIIHHLGQPNRTKLEGLAKEIWFDDVGLQFLLTKGRVYKMTMTVDKIKDSYLVCRYIKSIK